MNNIVSQKTPKASAARSARAAAILYIQSHDGLDAVKVGSAIHYAEPAQDTRAWTHSTFTVTAADLKLAAQARTGVVELSETPQDKRTAHMIEVGQ